MLLLPILGPHINKKIKREKRENTKKMKKILEEEKI
jgi:hypothetical protein